MERQPQPRAKKKDRTGALISFVLHVLIIGVVAYFVSKTEIGMQIRDKLLGTTRDKKVEDKPKPPPAKAIDKGKLKPPPGAPPPAGRKAVDAPAAVGEGIAVEDRTKKEAGPVRPTATAPVVQAPAYKPPPKVFTTAPSSVKQLLAERAKATAMVESFGSEQISKSGGSDVGDIVSRISGATVAEGKFAVVRGLADRYTLSTLNGVDIPSADPDRRAAQLDLFPAQFLNRVDVNKTFQPDLPGGFAGGAVNIVTRAFPERPIFSFSIGTSYNTQSSLRDDFLLTDQGSWDWFAMDDGTRALPGVAERTDPVGSLDPVDPIIETSFASRKFSPIAGDSAVNSSMSLAFGDTTYLFGRPLGFLAGVNYKTDYSHYSDGDIVKQGDAATEKPDETFSDARSVIEYMWGSLATLAYQISDNHQLSYNFMFVQTAEDEARHLRGEVDGVTDGDLYLDKQILHWTERNLNLMQFKGDHLFPDLADVRLDWVYSIANTSQDEPDHRIVQFLGNDTDHTYVAEGKSKPTKPTRLWRELQEDNQSFRTDLTIPLSPYSGRNNSIKTGYYVSQSEQTYDTRAWEVLPQQVQFLPFFIGHPFLTNGNANLLGDPRYNEHLIYKNFPANFQYVGEQTIQAGYVMSTWSPLEWLRVVGGVRYETTEITVDTVNITKADEQFFSSIDQKDLLPSLSATFTLTPTLQLRAGWSETIIRPIYREISRAELYEVARGRTIRGNTNLTLSASENFDARLEWYPRPGELISLGAFYKRIDRPIEQAQEDVTGEFIFYDNYEYADVFGVELELRKNFRGFWGAPYDQFSLGFNYAYIKSEVPRTQEQKDNQIIFTGETSSFRPLYDQPEYVLNADLTWDCFLSGTSITISGGVVGRRLVLVGYSTPDEYDEPAPQLEFSISQKIGRHWKARFSAKNLLDPVYETTQDWKGIGNVVVESYTKGMQFGLSVGCDF